MSAPTGIAFARNGEIAIGYTVVGDGPVDLVSCRSSATSFTDIVDSTSQAAALGDRRRRELRERHDLVVRGQLARHRGREIKSVGDGFLATFDGPARAVRCARAVCPAVRALGVEVRTGLHPGEIELDGDDISGVAVAIGAPSERSPPAARCGSPRR